MKVDLDWGEDQDVRDALESMTKMPDEVVNFVQGARFAREQLAERLHDAHESKGDKGVLREVRRWLANHGLGELT